MGKIISLFIAICLISSVQKKASILVSDPRLITNMKTVDSIVYYLLKVDKDNKSVDSLSITKNGIRARLYTHDEDYNYYQPYLYNVDNMNSILKSLKEYLDFTPPDKSSYTKFAHQYEIIQKIKYWWRKAIEPQLPSNLRNEIVFSK